MLVPRFVDNTATLSACDADPHQILALVRYGPGSAPQPVPCLAIDVPLRPLGHVYTEVWSCASPVERGEVAGVRFAHDEHTLMGVVECRPNDTARGFEMAISDAYARMAQAAAAAAFPYYLRIWNYLPHIHRTEGVLNRYQSFCRARYEPLTAHCRAWDDSYPAATAIGTNSDEVLIYFLSGKRPGRHVENPRQKSAYRYPKRYGPQSPSFARATLGEMESRAWLFVSGTASIVGHQSRHREDIVLQCNEVLENIEQLLKAADDKAGLDALAHIKVYLRHAGHLEVVREALRDRLKHGEPSLVLQGELCRTELLLEIEGLAMRECT